jgi:hypothetical protein
MFNTAFTRIRTCALAIAAVFFIGSQASAQQGGGPAVRVVNTPLPVLFDVGQTVAFTLGNVFGQSTIFPVSPAQRLVIEYVSGQCFNVPPSLFPIVFFSIVTSGVTNSHTIAIPFNPNPSANPINPSVWQLGQVVKIYADPGTNVTLTINGVCSLVFSGQFVNP